MKIRTLTKPKSTPAAPPVTYDWRIECAQAKISVIEQSIQEAVKFLKKHFSKRNVWSPHLPWYLMLGGEHVGKTALLAKSEQALVTTDHTALTYPHPTPYCDWWFNQDTVFLDTAGHLMLPEDPKNDSHYIWQKFIALLNRYGSRKFLDGLMICIDLQQFMQKNRGQKQLHIDMLRHRIQTITKYLKRLPVYIIFTKCDQIVGFTDSFHNLSPEDCQQPFGITLPVGLLQQNLPTLLDEKFNDFLRRLNDQLIPRLHSEHNIEKRARIKDFPLQLEALKRDIIHLAIQLQSSKANVTGLYFTSSLQDGKSSNSLTSLLYTFDLPSIQNIEQAPQQRAFFIRQLLQQIIHQKMHQPVTLPSWLNWKNKYFYWGLGGFMALATLLMIPSYYYNQATMNQVKQIMAAYQPPAHKTNLSAVLPSLNTLRRAYNVTNQQTGLLLSFVFSQNRALKTSLETSYNQALSTEFLPIITQLLENKLQATNHLNAKDYFDTLKVYLMLQDPQRFDRIFVEHWFANNWASAFGANGKAQKQLDIHLDYWLQLKSFKFIANPEIITLAQQRLNSLPLSELTYITLLERYPDTKLRMTSDENSVFPFAVTDKQLYSAHNFDLVYQKVIPSLVQRLVAGDNWVFNLKLPENLAGALSQQLVDNVQLLYVQRYADFWQNQLQNIRINSFHNLMQAQTFVDNWNASHSPFTHLLQQAAVNLEPIAKMPQAESVLLTFGNLETVLNQPPNFAALKGYLNNILQADDPGAAALQAAQNRMNNANGDPLSQLLLNAQSAPTPLNAWLTELALNTWQTLLHTARNHLNLIWITEVLPVYNEQVNNHYPVFAGGNTEMDITQFNHFFGPGGVMDHFTQKYLAAFVDNTQLYWQWKTQDGLSLDVPQATLDMLDRANIIRKMYFADHKILASKFTLTPLSMALMGNDFMFTLDNTQISYLRNLRQAKSLVWDGRSQFASLSLQNNSQNSVFWQESGPWSLFKLISHGVLTTTRNSQLYILTFNVDGVSVPYQLFSETPLNPFIPHLLDEFRCPGKL
ncbi:MAG: type VI secretion system membrane subunit TssM [Gammaproteobacteria bacterium]